MNLPYVNYTVNTYYSDFEDILDDYEFITTVAELQATGLKGYTLSKVIEMLNKGASFCRIYAGFKHIYCSNGIILSCEIDSEGSVGCSNGSYGSNIGFYGDTE